MRHIRNLLYALIGVLLGAIFTFAHADVIPATQSSTNYNWSFEGMTGTLQSIADTVCASWVPRNYPSLTNVGGNTTSSGYFNCKTKDYTGAIGYIGGWQASRGSPLYECPTGYDGPKTINGTANMCESLGKCATSKDSEGWVSHSPSASYTGTVCIDGCNYQQSSVVESTAAAQAEHETRIGKDGKVWDWVSQTALKTECSTGSEAPAPSTSGAPGKNHTPLCGAAEGVMTSSSGKVICVPEGTPDSRKPDIQKKSSIEKFADNSTKTTETVTTTDPQTNAKDTQTTTTTTGGLSGSAGTTTTSASSSGKTGSESGSCTGDNCTDNAKTGAFGEYGKLWEKKYPDGAGKVVTDKVAEMKNTGLAKLIRDLAPTGIGNTGQCPAWTFNANIGPKMNFGTGSYAPPCWLWSALRVVFLITTLFVARRIIFGG